MDKIDREIAKLLQSDGRASSAEIATTVGISVSTASERVRRLVSSGTITEWRGVVDSKKAGAALCVFVFLDVSYDGEAQTCSALQRHDEVLELHHISGRNSYLMKLRVQNTNALQQFLHEHVKPLAAVEKTETLLSLEALKETSVVKFATSEPES